MLYRAILKRTCNSVAANHKVEVRIYVVYTYVCISISFFSANFYLIQNSGCGYTACSMSYYLSDVRIRF